MNARRPLLTCALLWASACIGCGAASSAETRTTVAPVDDGSATWGGDSGYVDPYTAALAARQGGLPQAAAPSVDALVTEALDTQELMLADAEPASAGDSDEPAPPPAPSPPPPPPLSAQAAANLAKSPPGSGPEKDTASAQEHGLSLIYDARVFLAVFDSARVIDKAEALARENGGYLVHRGDQRITFRVPTSAFQATLSAALALGDVLHREVNVRDVTEEFRDLRVRLRNAEAVRDRLEQLLARADTVENALRVEQQLERVSREIEQLKGRLALLSELTSFSTITIELRPRPVDRIESRVRLPFPWLDELGLSGLLQL